MEHRVIIALASNRYQKNNLSKARRCLEEIVHHLRFTSEHWTEPCNTNRPDNYLNQIAEGTTELDEAALNAWLKQTELNFGRTDRKRRLGIVPIDLDILQYDDDKRHLSDWSRSYVADLIGELDGQQAQS